MCLSTLSFAQKPKKVSAEYIYHTPDNITLDQAKRTALERAQIQALADAFGTVVSQSNSTIVSNANGQSDTRFFSLGSSDVKGEWIETIGEPKYYISYEQGMLVVKVYVEGHAREITSASIDIIAKVLRNGIDEKFESTEFRNGDDLYLYFKSPVDGYLTVYLHDETTKMVYCLLPYKVSNEGAYRIEHDKEYILFSSDYASKEELPCVDEYTMTCEKAVEYNNLYVVFSPNEFFKANTSGSGTDVVPRELSWDDFQKWISKLKKNNNSLITNSFLLTIKFN